MKKNIVTIVFLTYSLFLFGCAGARSGIPEADGTQGKSAELNSSETQTEGSGAENPGTAMENVYYRMSYTKDVDVDAVMNALLMEDAEKKAYETAQMEETISAAADSPSRKWSMTVDGVAYRWEEANGAFTYFVDRPYEGVAEDQAEKIARDFLDRLGLESSNELQIKAWEDGTVEILCRLYYNGVKLMGVNALYFEPDNEDEIPLTGSYISLLLSGDRIHNVQINAIPQMVEILETYNAEKDFLTVEEAEAVTKQYLEMIRPPWPNTEPKTELIYMPYRDPANGNVHVLLPAYEVYVPRAPGDGAKATIFYVDAVTGYIYNAHSVFY